MTTQPTFDRWGGNGGLAPGSVESEDLADDAIDVGRTAWIVPAPIGDDATGVVGAPHRPFATVQGGVDAIIALGLNPEGSHTGACMIMSGAYDEVVTVTGQAAGTVGIRFQGFGGVVGFRQLVVNAHATNQVNVFLDNLQLGSGLGSAVDDHVIKYVGAGGFYSLRMTDCSVLMNDAGVFDCINEDGAGAGGFTFEATNCRVAATAGTSSAVVIGKGNAVISNALTAMGAFSWAGNLFWTTTGQPIAGNAAPAIVLSGTANLTVRDVGMATNGSGIDVIDHTGSGLLVVSSCTGTVEPASTGGLIGDSSGAGVGIAAVFQASLFRGVGGTGGIDMPAGGVITERVIGDQNELLPVVGGAFERGTDGNHTKLVVGANAFVGAESLRVAGVGRYEDTQQIADDTELTFGDGDDFTITHANATDDVSFTSVNANAKLIWQLGSSNATSDFRIQEAGGNIVFRVDGAERIGLHGATPQAQNPGWTVTNHATTKTFNANATTVDELADVLGTLIEDFLKLRGDLGA